MSAGPSFPVTVKKRHSRQARLADVGEAGQARIASRVFAISGRGVAGDVEARYLAGAGVAGLAVASVAVAASAREVDAEVRIEPLDLDDRAGYDVDADRLPSALGIDDPSAHAVALGAYRALVKLRRVLAEARKLPLAPTAPVTK